MTLLEDLRDTLTYRPASVVFIVGAGVSVGAVRGSPCQAHATWIGLLADGLRRIHDLGGIDNNTLTVYRQNLELSVLLALLSVADLVTHSLEAPKGGEFSRWLRETSRFPFPAPLRARRNGNRESPFGASCLAPARRSAQTASGGTSR